MLTALLVAPGSACRLSRPWISDVIADDDIGSVTYWDLAIAARRRSCPPGAWPGRWHCACVRPAQPPSRYMAFSKDLVLTDCSTGVAPTARTSCWTSADAFVLDPT